MSGLGQDSPGRTAAAGPERLHREAQDRALAAGKTLSKEEQAKRDKDALALWDEFRANAASGAFPEGARMSSSTSSPACSTSPRRKIPSCAACGSRAACCPSWQFRGVADLADRHGGGYADVTTRANLQIREIGPRDGIHVLTGLTDLGIVTRGSGADNIRNVTASPTSGIDPQELIETLPLAKEMHHHILNHRELYGLPRKFNIAFDGGGRIASLEDTNDIGFRAVRVEGAGAGDDLPSGVYFQLALGGITGHKDFARPTGVLLRPEECVPGRRGDRSRVPQARRPHRPQEGPV